jgi:hypothetical protein
MLNVLQGIPRPGSDSMAVDSMAVYSDPTAGGSDFTIGFHGRTHFGAVLRNGHLNRSRGGMVREGAPPLRSHEHGATAAAARRLVGRMVI